MPYGVNISEHWNYDYLKQSWVKHLQDMSLTTHSDMKWTFDTLKNGRLAMWCRILFMYFSYYWRVFPFYFHFPTLSHSMQSRWKIMKLLYTQSESFGNIVKSGVMHCLNTTGWFYFKCIIRWYHSFFVLLLTLRKAINVFIYSVHSLFLFHFFPWCLQGQIHDLIISSGFIQWINSLILIKRF